MNLIHFRMQVVTGGNTQVGPVTPGTMLVVVLPHPSSRRQRRACCRSARETSKTKDDNVEMY